MLQFICQFGFEEPAQKGLTPFYTHIVQSLINNFTRKRSLPTLNIRNAFGCHRKTEDEGACETKKLIHQIILLADLALKKLTEKEDGLFLFHKRELSSAGIDLQLFLQIGLLNPTGYLDQSFYRFVHKSIQEFMAAFAVSRCRKM